MSKKAQVAGEPYNPDELRPGIVAFFSGEHLDKAMSRYLSETDKPYSCDDRSAVMQPFYFLCIHRVENARKEEAPNSHRHFWVPLFRSDGDRKQSIDVTATKGQKMFTDGAYFFDERQVWVARDDVIIEVAQMQTMKGKTVLKDLTTKEVRNTVDASAIPALTNFPNAVQSWVKKTTTSHVKPKETVAQRDPTDARRLFRDFRRDSVSKFSATQEREQKKLREAVLDEYPGLADFVDELLPKGRIMLVQAQHGVQLLLRLPLENASDPKDILFFQHNQGPWFPTLRIIHQYPWIAPGHQVDVGGCRHMVAGADLMCPGITSPGGKIDPKVISGAPCVIHVEGKKTAAAIGYAVMKPEEIVPGKMGICVENVHHLGDGLWMNPSL